ncbi:MAG: heavy metal translocating P-type ATPase [Candidatus Hodarchaeales archaeon]
MSFLIINEISGGIIAVLRNMMNISFNPEVFLGRDRCIACIDRAIKSLKGLTGVNSALFNGKKINIQFDDRILSKEDIHDQLSEHFNEILKRYNHRKYKVIKGMDCPSCAENLEKAVFNVNGISNSKVNFSTATLNIEIDSNLLEDEDSIKRRIEKQTGFKLLSSREEQPELGGIFKNRRFQILVVAGIALITSLLTEHFILPVMVEMDQFIIYIESLIVIIYVFTIIATSYDLIRAVFFSLKAKRFNIDSLMLVAIFGAVLIGQLEEAAMVSLLFFTGNTLEEYSLDKMRKSVDRLIKVNPETVELKNGEIVRVEDVRPGDVAIFKPGSIISLDGTVVKGITSVLEANITGEPLPTVKCVNSSVYAGTENIDGYIEVEVSKSSADSVLSTILKLIEEARNRKASTEKFAEMFGKYYTPVVFLLALVIAVGGGIAGLPVYQSLYIAITLLIISCPCALVISTPVSVVSAIENAARNGVMIKGGDILEYSAIVDTLFFDKTGTLTTGKPKVAAIKSLVSSQCEEELLKIAAALESLSEHPIASSIVTYSSDRGVSFRDVEVTSFKIHPGKGVEGIISDTKYYIGTKTFLEEKGMFLRDNFSLELFQEKQVENMETKTVVFMGRGAEIIGSIQLVDNIRDDGVSVIQKLKSMGYNPVMVTGDSESTAKETTSVLGIEEYHSSLLPSDKESLVVQRRKEGSVIAMIGDGVNDAPALAAANVGISMGGIGSPATIETSDIVLMNDNLSKLPELMNLSRKTSRIIKINILISLLTIVILITLSLAGWLTMSLGVLGHEGSALLVILISMSILKHDWGSGTATNSCQDKGCSGYCEHTE